MTESQQRDKHKIARMHPGTKASIANAASVEWDARRAALAADKTRIRQVKPNDESGSVALFSRLPGSFESNARNKAIRPESRT